MSKIPNVREGSSFVAPIRKTHTGFQTIWGELETEFPELPDDATITRITSDVNIREGAAGRGYVNVDAIKESGSGSTQYLWVTIKRFDLQRRNSEASQNSKGTTYTSHVDRSHRDTATPRANQYDSDLY